jgi:phage baseplate assembly protein W
MATLGVKLPITRNDIYGYTMIDNVPELIRQNLKMLILTNPGERVMIPEFGVGIQSYLFENFSDTIYIDIENAIKKQVRKYMPVVSIQNVLFDTSEPDNNKLGISIRYSIPAINIKDLLEFTI